MDKHVCDRDKDIVKLQVDQEWMQQATKEIKESVDKMTDTFHKGDGKINRLNKTTYGNGEPGLVQRIGNLEEEVGKMNITLAKWSGAISLIVFVIVYSKDWFIK